MNTELINLIASIGTAVVLLAVIGNSIRVNRKLSTLQKTDDELKSTVNECMAEFGKIAAELSRVAVGHTLAESTPAPIEDGNSAGTRKPTSRIDEKYHVLQLARQGKPINEISQKLKIPSGEVQLILSLYRASSAGRAATAQ